jgi:YfiR/HmsC-like
VVLSALSVVIVNRDSRGKCLLVLAVACLSLFVNIQSFAAEADDEAATKANYLYNAAKFIKWPNQTLSFNLCTKGAQPLMGKIALLQAKKIGLQPIGVLEIDALDDVHNCRVLFISASEKIHLPKIMQAIAGLPIVTVSDMPGFVDNNGMIGLKVTDGRVRFDINLAAAQRVGLVLDSQLLNLADEVVQ